jgi:c-di-AMP phosphodiesterase-like protein
MDLSLNEIIYIILGFCFLFYLVMFMLLKKHRKKEQIKKTGIEEKNNVRYTVKNQPVVKVDVITGEEEVNITYEREDILLRRSYKYIVGATNKIKPGKYMLLTTEEAMTEFNIRRNGYVRSYDHNSHVILAEGDDLTAINIAIILR